MSQVTPVVAVLEALRIVMADVAGLPRRVQIRTALPLLDQLTQYGYPLAALSDELQKAKLELKPKALSQALVRWRREQLEIETSQANSLGQVTTVQDAGLTVASAAISLGTSPSGDLSSALLTKARLKQIREFPIDSGRLERAYRQSRGSS